MLRMVTAGAAAVLAVGVDSTDFDLFRYGITQGGLLVVVLVLLWSYRKDLTKLIDRQDQTIKMLTDLVVTNTSTMARLMSASEQNADAVDRLTEALDRFKSRN